MEQFPSSSLCKRRVLLLIILFDSLAIISLQNEDCGPEGLEKIEFGKLWNPGPYWVWLINLHWWSLKPSNPQNLYFNKNSNSKNLAILQLFLLWAVKECTNLPTLRSFSRRTLTHSPKVTGLSAVITALPEPMSNLNSGYPFCRPKDTKSPVPSSFCPL